MDNTERLHGDGGEYAHG